MTNHPRRASAFPQPGKRDECPHNEDRASCAVGCGSTWPAYFETTPSSAAGAADQPTMKPPRDAFELGERIRAGVYTAAAADQPGAGHGEQYRVNEHTIDWRYVVDQPGAEPAPSAGQDTERLRDEGRCSGELCWYTLPLVDGMVVAHSKAGVLEACEGGGRPPAPAQPKLVRQLQWFTDDELRAELQRRALDGPS